nr:immunoglobulin light chain junction region [Macaca mulatta]
CMQGIQLPSF